VLYNSFLDESVEPPRRIQVIAGPQANTLPSLVNAARGHRVLIDGRQAQEITNPLSTFQRYLLFLIN
jgi:hypothetical protein